MKQPRPAFLLALAGTLALAGVSSVAWAAGAGDPVESLSIVLRGLGILVAALGSLFGLGWVGLNLGGRLWSPVGRTLERLEEVEKLAAEHSTTLRGVPGDDEQPGLIARVKQHQRALYGEQGNPADNGLTGRMGELSAVVEGAETETSRQLKSLREDLLGARSGEG